MTIFFIKPKILKIQNGLGDHGQKKPHCLFEFYILYKGCNMPTLSMFFGIIIRMYYAPK